MQVSATTKSQLEPYLTLVSQRASGQLMTTASWIRQFVRQHPDYKHDSQVSQQVQFDLIKACRDITYGKLKSADLLGNFEV